MSTLTSSVSDAPFWTGRPDAATFERQQDSTLARARQGIARLVDPATPRTIDGALRAFDEVVRDIEAASLQASLMENVHPRADVREAAERVGKRAAALAAELSLHRGAYEALSAVDLTGAEPETRHYLEKTLRDFRLSGVDRDDATRARIAELRQELVEIGQEFSRHIRSDARTIVADSADELEGLPADFIARHPAGPDGRVTLTTDGPDSQPVLAYATRAELRRRMYLAHANRAYPENVPVLARLLAKRHELATLLGFPHWAEYVTADKMSAHASVASEFIDRIVAVSAPRALKDYEQLLARKRADEPSADAIEAWESAFWTERVRRSEYAFDAQSVRPYLAFDRVLQGALDVSARLFDVRFQRVAEAPVWHPDVQCWEMWEGERLAGRFYLDMHPRENKYKHAAEFDVRSGLAGREIPEAALVCNFPGGVDGDPGLMEHNDVRTLFHEFGHLLHGLFGGHRKWSGTSGIRTEHDFIEVPSQLFEEWIWDPAVLATFARHHETDAPIPAELVRQMRRASEFGQGLYLRRQMVFARISMSAYDRDPAQVDFDALVEQTQRAYSPIRFVPGTHLQCSFGHLEAYSAAYYAYMWSLVIVKDFFGRFPQDDLLAPSVAREYRDKVLVPGGSAPAADLVRSFLGREFQFEAFQRWIDRRE
jgi:thimet oligopeptidase